MYTDKVTICIPVYERYDYFEEAISSAMNQTVSCKIIVNDNNSSHSKFKDFCSENNIEYHKNDVNVGVFPNWNKCMQRAKTPYVVILGDDDVLYANYIEKFLEAEERYSGLDFYYTNIDWLVDDVKKDWGFPAIYGLFDRSLDIQELGAKEWIGIPSISGTFRRDVMLEKPFAESFYGSNDWLWLYSNVHTLKVYGNKEKLYVYRRHGKQDSQANEFITYYWCYPAIYYIIHEVLNGKSQYAGEALNKSVSFALSSIYMFKFKFVDYYHSQNDNNLYKYYYKEKLSKKSRLLYAITLPRLVANQILKLYFAFKK
ncbi:glycosyltransferase family 2 protein [Hymenobacter cavernae]|uniref:Glycosyltransferase 2-like domain-containing protein n=1 Tax=Hymenobacter cavernae TaxID=2044852 RepID=A0ABQ1UMB3_9BACT|nr:glycosyltransferase [Hymenobacter cavernae]GGF20554.1 hypothetical protein GCM10011383_35250 [Hymenobacter cavernae]